MSHPYRTTYVCEHCQAKATWRAKWEALDLGRLFSISLGIGGIGAIGAWFGYPLGHPLLGALACYALLFVHLWFRWRGLAQER